MRDKEFCNNYRFINDNLVGLNKGDIGDAFYIILSGGVTILIDEPTEYKNFMQLVRII